MPLKHHDGNSALCWNPVTTWHDLCRCLSNQSVTDATRTLLPRLRPIRWGQTGLSGSLLLPDRSAHYWENFHLTALSQTNGKWWYYSCGSYITPKNNGCIIVFSYIASEVKLGPWREGIIDFWSLEFYILSSSKVISGWVMICDLARLVWLYRAAALGNQVSCTVTQHHT